ncbi:hypothetical protein AB4Y45_27815 [Paraburkholderia sp. EG287A]|uniref:hypothetical protein n=1 Tax=Paraburkholderia sp. EG287A TaxID=3237012 RepID=UPI0034D36DB3
MLDVVEPWDYDLNLSSALSIAPTADYGLDPKPRCLPARGFFFAPTKLHDRDLTVDSLGRQASGTPQMVA